MSVRNYRKVTKPVQTIKIGEKNMSTKNFLTIVTLVAVLSLIASGCSGIGYAAAPTDTPPASLPEATSQLTPTDTTQPAAPEAFETLTVTLDELVGTWFNGSYLSFKSNGAYVVYASLEALQAGQGLDEGEYGVQGDQLWLGPMSSHCNGMGFYQLTSKDENGLEFTKIREECSRSLGKLQRVTP